MSNYTPVNDYSAKDALSSGDPSKKILGSEIDAEFTAIQTAIASKLDSSGGTDLAVADGGTGASTAADARTNLGLGTMATQAASAVAITGGSITGISDLSITSTDAGATTGPQVQLMRSSASPALNDQLGIILFSGKDSGGNDNNYGSIYTYIADATDGNEDGVVVIQTQVGGTLAARAILYEGLQVGAATGGDKGAGTVNATAYYQNNVQQGAWTSFTPTVTLAGGAGNTVPVYSTNTGRYARVGSTVIVHVYLTGDGGAEGAGTGVVNIALPVAASADNPAGYFPVGLALNNATYMHLFGQITASATTVSMAYMDTISSLSGFTGAAQNNATRTIRLSFSYEV